MSRRGSKADNPSRAAGAGPLAGKVALVTGAALRVGRAIALGLAREGMDVALTWHASGAEARWLVGQIESLGREALAIRVDLGKPGAAGRVREALLSRFGRLDALVNNAALYRATPLGRVRPWDFDEHMAVNARAPLMLIQELAELLAAHHRAGDPGSAGRIVNLVDIHVLGQHRRGHLAYSASKAALLEITFGTARSLAPKVTVNAVAPGVVAWARAYTPAQRRRYLERVPMVRAGTPQDAAAAVLFLVRDAHYCTGQVIRVDGGRLLT